MNDFQLTQLPEGHNYTSHLFVSTPSKYGLFGPATVSGFNYLEGYVLFIFSQSEFVLRLPTCVQELHQTESYDEFGTEKQVQHRKSESMLTWDICHASEPNRLSPRTYDPL